jgi:hypothetical protein
MGERGIQWTFFNELDWRLRREMTVFESEASGDHGIL